MSNRHDESVVFVVDDEYAIASTLATILRENGFNATSFTDPLRALRASHFRAPALLISDLAMPCLSGVELATKIKAFCPDCKVLIFSSVVDLFMHRSPQLSRFEILEKPLHPTLLLRRIEQLLDQAHSGAVSPRLTEQNSAPKVPVQSLAALRASPLGHGHPARGHR